MALAIVFHTTRFLATAPLELFSASFTLRYDQIQTTNATAFICAFLVFGITNAISCLASGLRAVASGSFLGFFSDRWLLKQIVDLTLFCVTDGLQIAMELNVSSLYTSLGLK